VKIKLPDQLLWKRAPWYLPAKRLMNTLEIDSCCHCIREAYNKGKAENENKN